MIPARRTCLVLGALGVVEALIGRSVLAQGAAKNPDKERIIKIVAQKFSYAPNEIVLKKGQPVILEFTALDFVHGFKIPDLNIRADLPPGKLTLVRFTPEKAGVLDFLCDNFCGSGHEEMSGKFLVRN